MITPNFNPGNGKSGEFTFRATRGHGLFAGNLMVTNNLTLTTNFEIIWMSIKYQKENRGNRKSGKFYV